MNSLEKMKKLNISYSEVAAELGVCEMSVRNKLSGKTKFSKLELEKLEQIFKEKEDGSK